MFKIVTISRECGSGGSAIARRLAQALNLQCVGKELVYEIARHAGVQTALVEKYDQDSYSKWNLILDSLCLGGRLSADYGVTSSASTPEPETFFTEEKYRQTTQAILLKLAESPGIIFLGRGSQVVFRNRPDALHLRLVAPLDLRIRRIAETLQLPAREAARKVQEMDKSRERYLRDFYSAEVADPDLYHLTLNTGRFSLGETCRLIQEAIHPHVHDPEGRQENQ
jgi:cytidylate kinase